MRRALYFGPFVLFAPSFLAMFGGGALTWFLPVFTFVVIPLVELFTPGTTANMTPQQEEAALSDRVYDAFVYLVVPAQVALVVAFLWRMQVGGYAPWETAGAIGTMGIACGVFGINVGHELGHRRHKAEQILAKILLTTSLYLHFFVEHNRGHHRRVATPEDPATARRGENLYAFWVRSVTGGLRSAWALEAARLERDGKSPWSWSNETLRAFVIQGALLVGIGLIAGPWPLAAFVMAATCGFLLLETVNYVEHYGLVRARTPHGVYERVRPEHSWNSERAIGRVLLFDLTRHSDHHANATRKYQILRHHDGVPELPAGYPAMIVLALFPPLFKAVMERSLQAWSGTGSAEILPAT